MAGLTIDNFPLCNSEPERAIPHYLIAHYWWAYTHPAAVRVFERPWLVNLILFGNYARLCNAVLAEFGESLPGRTLQVACVYGDLTPKLSRRVAQSGGVLDVVDVVPLQLQNLARKLPKAARTRLIHMDSAKLEAPSSRYDRALAFFLLHEQPAAHRDRPFGGMNIERTWYAADKTGFHMLHTLFQTSLNFRPFAPHYQAGTRCPTYRERTAWATGGRATAKLSERTN